MNLVDSSGWIEYLVGGANADFFATPLLEVDELLVPSLCIFEVYRHVLRERGRSDALTVAASMRQGHVLALDEGLAVEAAEVGATYHLPLPDAVIYASAMSRNATLWTQDADFKGLPGVEYAPKRRGR